MAPGERPLVGYAFRYSTFAFYLHTEVVLTDRRLYAARPNTLFGLIPAGTRRSAFPVENVASVTAQTRVGLGPLVLGLLSAWVAIYAFSTPGMFGGGVGWAIIAGLFLLAVPRQAIEVLNSGGGAIRFPVNVFQRSRAVEFADRVSESLAQIARPGAVRPAAAPASTTQDLSDALRQLAQLRDQDFVTEEEYEAKRAEILGRL